MKKLTATVLATIASILPTMFAGQQTRQQADSNGSGQIVVAKKTANLLVELANNSGRFIAGNNSLCVLFRDAQTHTLVEVQNVSVQFRQQVGKITEVPITAKLKSYRSGIYCGYVDLGPQYYFPSSYYVLVKFVTSEGRSRTVRLFTSVR